MAKKRRVSEREKWLEVELEHASSNVDFWSDKAISLEAEVKRLAVERDDLSKRIDNLAADFAQRKATLDQLKLEARYANERADKQTTQILKLKHDLERMICHRELLLDELAKERVAIVGPEDCRYEILNGERR